MDIRQFLVPIAAALVLGGALAPPAAGQAKRSVVHIKNFTFIPAALTVSPGTVVTFVNDDDEPHTVTATNKSFDSEGLDKNAHWTHTFAKPGSFTYFCELHPMMKGRLIVKGAS
jgi:plastocyanin